MKKVETLRDILEKQIELNFPSLAQRDALRYYLGFKDGKRYKHTDIVKMTGVNRSTTYAIPDKLFTTLKIGENRKKLNKYFTILKEKLAKLFYISNDEEMDEFIFQDERLSRFFQGTSIMLISEIFQKVEGMPLIFDIRKKMDKKKKFHSEASPNWLWSYLPEELVRFTVFFLKETISDFCSPISYEEFGKFMRKMSFFKEELKNVNYYMKNGLLSFEEDLEKFLIMSLGRLPQLLPDFVVVDDKIFLRNWIKRDEKGNIKISYGAKLYLFNYAFRKLGRWVELDDLVETINKEFGSYLPEEISKKDFQRRENNKKYFTKKKGNNGEKEWGLKDWEIYGSKLKAINRKLKGIEKKLNDEFSDNKEESRWKTKPDVDMYIDNVLKKVKSPGWKIPSDVLEKYGKIFEGKSKDELKKLVQWKNLAYYILKISGERMSLKHITELAIYLKAHFDKQWKKAGKTPHITILGELTYRDKDGKFIDYGDWVFGLKEKRLVSTSPVEEIAIKEVYCPTCGKKMAPEWRLCPYDGTPLG